MRGEDKPDAFQRTIRVAQCAHSTQSWANFSWRVLLKIDGTLGISTISSLRLRALAQCMQVCVRARVHGARKENRLF